MYCKYCGRELMENGGCSCRSQAPEAPVSAAVPPVYQPGQIYYGAPPYYPPAAPTYLPVVALLKAHFSSKLMLALCIVASLGIPAVLTMQVFPFNTANFSNIAAIGCIYYMMGMYPGILTAVGLWIFYGACKSRTNFALKATGLRLVKISYMIILIFHAFYLSMGAFAALYLPFWNRFSANTTYVRSGSELLNRPEMVALMVGIGLFLLLLGAFCVISTVFVAKSASSLMNICRFGSYDGKLSRFMIILIFVFAGLTLLSLFAFGFQCSIAVLVQATYLVLLGQLLLKLRRMLQPFTPTYVMMQGGT